jgi:hypothetical protein
MFGVARVENFSVEHTADSEVAEHQRMLAALGLDSTGPADILLANAVKLDSERGQIATADG